MDQTAREALRAELRAVILERSLRVSDHAEFKLVSGKMSRFYVDCKGTLLLPRGLALVGRLMWDTIKGKRPDAVGGLTLGADPITVATALAAHAEGVELLPLIVRKEAKKHGTQKWIEGYAREGLRVVAVDDVFTTGNSTLQAIERFREAGMEVVEAVAMIDRDEGADENFQAAGVPYGALFSLEELLEATGKVKPEL